MLGAYSEPKRVREKERARDEKYIIIIMGQLTLDDYISLVFIIITS